MIKPTTREKIKGFLEGFLEVQLQKHQKAIQSGTEKKRLKTDAKAGKLKPFHLAILPTEAIRLSSFERSFSTSLGNTFEECAKLIALDCHREAGRSRILTGQISRRCLAEIERVRSLIDGGHAINYLETVDRVIKANTREEVEIRTITDVYLKTKAGREFYFEIKSPKPNKGQGIEVTDRLLRTHAIRQTGPPKVQTFYAMAYNPYGSRRDYHHSFAIQHLDMEHQVVIQEEFWDIIGGKGTFSNLLEIYAEVGKEKGRQVIQRLGYNFE